MVRNRNELKQENDVLHNNLEECGKLSETMKIKIQEIRESLEHTKNAYSRLIKETEELSTDLTNVNEEYTITINTYNHSRKRKSDAEKALRGMIKTIAKMNNSSSKQ